MKGRWLLPIALGLANAAPLVPPGGGATLQAADTGCQQGPNYNECLRQERAREQQEQQQRQQQQREQQERLRQQQEERARQQQLLQQQQQQQQQQRARRLQEQQRAQQQEEERARQQQLLQQQQQRARQLEEQHRAQQQEEERARQRLPQQPPQPQRAQQPQEQLPEHAQRPPPRRQQEQERAQRQPQRQQPEQRQGQAPQRQQPEQARQPQRPQQPVRPVRLDPATTVVPHADRGGFTVNRKQANGADVVVNSRVLPNGQRHLEAYRQTVNPGTGERTRVFLDGRRIVQQRNGDVTQSWPGRPTLTHHRDGLREAALPDGRPLYREEFATVRWHDRDERAIRRTVFTTVVASAVVVLATPVVQVYGVVPWHGFYIYPYYPAVFAPPFYSFFYAPFPAPVVVTPGCVWCPPPAVAFAAPVAAYADPDDLVGDLQIATAFDDGMSYLPPPPPPPGAPPPSAPPPDDEVQALAAEVDQLQQQVAAQAATNDELKSELAAQQAQIADLQAERDARTSAAPAARTPVPVPEPVRRQVREEVKEEIALHQQQTTRTIADVVAAPEAEKYIFQVADLIDTSDVNTGEECVLTTGDLLSLNEVPTETAAAAEMRVVTSKEGSCKPGAIVEIGLADLQEMLNGFSQRLERNMQKVHDQIATAPPR